MTPYRNAVQYLFRVILLVSVFPLYSLAAQNPVHPALSPLAKRGFTHFYNMESDKAIHDFETLVKENPEDPFANNYLLTAVLFKELYRIGAMDTESYADDSFLDLKPKKQFDPEVATRVRDLLNRSEELCNQRLAKNPNDIDALYARGVARGMRSTYMGMGEKAWLAAVKSALSARRDHEKVLQLDPSYIDAKMVVGVHNYIIGSLNWFYRSMIALAGVTGNRQKGLQYLREVAGANCTASMDAKIALALFLRREQKYPEALTVVKSMVDEYPKNYIAAVEYANLLNAAGRGPEAIGAFQGVLAGCKESKFPVCEPQMVAYRLGVALRGQRRFEEAALAFDEVSTFPEVDKKLSQRANLAAGQMYDSVQKRDIAVKKYKEVLTADRTTPEAQLAKKYVDKPYRQD
jgi:tetratricopeptide (TPR) repeat protein